MRSRTCLFAFLALSVSSGWAADPRAAKYYEDALTRYEKQDLDGAIIQLKNALQVDNGMLTVHLLLGKALLENGEVAAAEVALLEALRLGGESRRGRSPPWTGLSCPGKAQTCP